MLSLPHVHFNLLQIAANLVADLPSKSGALAAFFRPHRLGTRQSKLHPQAI